MAVTAALTISANSSNQTLNVVNTTSYDVSPDTIAELGTIVIMTSLTSKGNVMRLVPPTNGNYQGDTTYSLVVVDAVKLKVELFVTEKWSAGAYAEDDIVIEGGQNKFYRATTATSNILSHADWEELDLTVSQDLRKFDTLSIGNLVDSAATTQGLANIAKYVQNLTNTQELATCYQNCEVSEYEKIRLLYEGIVHNTDNDERQLMFEQLLELKKQI